MEGLTEFLNIFNGDGSGSGYVCGSGSGYVCGYGDGYGDGYGFGFGFGDGFGYSSSSCTDIIMFNTEKIYRIDEVPTIIRNIKKQIAKGFIV